jgi:hypothetical protein
MIIQVPSFCEQKLEIYHKKQHSEHTIDIKISHGVVNMIIYERKEYIKL